MVGFWLESLTGRSLERLRVVHSFSNGPVDLNGSIHWNVIGLYNEILIGLSKSQVEYGSSIQSIGVDSWRLGLRTSGLGRSFARFAIPLSR